MKQVKTEKSFYYKDKQPTRIWLFMKNYGMYLIESKNYKPETAGKAIFFKFVNDIMNHPFYKSKGYTLDQVCEKVITNFKMSLSENPKFGQLNIRKKAGMLKTK